jgi:oligosaccharide translocation protein RFT1
MASSLEGSTSQDEANSKASSLLTKSTQGATFLIILQIGSRALTFVVNQLLLRYLSPELLGIATQLEVYSISVLFFAREALRVAIQRQVDVAEPKIKDTQSKRHILDLAAEKSQALVNLSYISICLGILFSVALGWAYLQSSSSNTSLLETPYFNEALLLYGIAALCELLAEPSFVVVQQKSNYKTRAAAESVATLCRSFLTCGLVILPAFRDMNLGVLPFAIGQCVYGISLFVVYSFGVWSIASSDGFSLVPRSLSNRYLSPQYILYDMLIILAKMDNTSSPCFPNPS